MEELRKELNDAFANCKTIVPHPRKYLLLAIDAPLKILIGNLQDHHYHPFTSLNLNPYLKAEATLKPPVYILPGIIWLTLYLLQPWVILVPLHNTMMYL